MVNYSYYPLSSNINYQPVLCVEGFITEDNLAQIDEQIKTIDKQAALVGYNNPKNNDEFEEQRLNAHSIRKSNVGFLASADWDWLYDKLSDAVKHVNMTNYQKTLYGISPLQYSEYDSQYNGFYGPHRDVMPRTNYDLQRSLSFSLQLSNDNDYVGGELKIYELEKTYISNKKKGSITFFDSSLLHEVTPVTSGFRKSIVGWVLGPRV